MDPRKNYSARRARFYNAAQKGKAGLTARAKRRTICNDRRNVPRFPRERPAVPFSDTFALSFMQ
jgi:hypothetical protein